MTSQFPEKRKKRIKEPFGELMKAMNTFFNERPIKGFLSTMDDFFDQPFAQTSFPVDVIETEKEYVITAQLPGVMREQINIHTLGNQLTISIDYREQLEELDEENKFFRQRKTFGKTSRTVTLPAPIDEAKVKATHKDGLLQVRVTRKNGKVIQID